MERAVAEHLLNVNWVEFEQRAKNKTNDPFYFFQLEYLFDIDEDRLRSQYFEVCSRYVSNENILSKAHYMYQSILNPLRRLDFIIEHYFTENDAENEYSVEDIDTENPYSQWIDSLLDENQLLKCRNEIQQRIVNLYDEISETLKNKQIHKLIVYRKKLSYLLNIKKMLWSATV